MKRFLLLIVSLLSLGVSRAERVDLQTSKAASVLVCGGSMMNGDQFADSVQAVMKTHYAGCKKIALVLHATLPEDRDRMEERLRKAFQHLGGFAVESLHRHDRSGQRALLEKADGIFVGGGETFVLLSDLYRSGQIDILRRRVLAGIPFGGTSAGANVAGLLIGTTNDFPVTFVPTRRALAVFPAVINPHHPLPANKADFDGRVGKIKAYLRFNPDETVFALSNAAIARLNGGRVTLEAGAGWVYHGAGVRELKLGEEVPELMPKS
ncbi:hypothetical protein CMV30_11975 [Nibricoccus aquaticus]|uniref:Dipeptidase E n=1 Tax=Nibricoccus aquaticus TaxID=2576891 RepID=A0A290QEC9_9BACT|nr:Type 1 glutamine amidotransferase-like domain-containing protein [Nibricoccus aquaticus]ATC64616.1 hypothetical protein CMV30_11975 [Nibricoccus aquaticus]